MGELRGDRLERKGGGVVDGRSLRKLACADCGGGRPAGVNYGSRRVPLCYGCIRVRRKIAPHVQRYRTRLAMQRRGVKDKIQRSVLRACQQRHGALPPEGERLG